MDKNEIRGLATGIGSLPHKEADKALDLVFSHVPAIPFWPQLPKRDLREGMIAQYSQGLPCVKVTDKGLSFEATNRDEELERFYEQIISRNIDYFRISRDFAEGLYAFKERLGRMDTTKIKRIKCHVTGPFTFAAGLKDEKGVSILHEPIFMQAFTSGLAMKAIWQVRFLEGSAKIIIFVDEPFLGCFGSAYTPINREDVINVLSEFTGQIVKDTGAEVGVHCCGNTDWSIFTDVKTIKIINFDAFGYLDRLVLYAPNLKKFLESGGMLCWGIVPTDPELAGKVDLEGLVARLKEGIQALTKKGLDRELLLNSLLLSPACGLGSMTIDQAVGIFALLRELKNKLFDKV